MLSVVEVHSNRHIRGAHSLRYAQLPEFVHTAHTASESSSVRSRNAGLTCSSWAATCPNPTMLRIHKQETFVCVQIRRSGARRQ